MLLMFSVQIIGLKLAPGDMYTFVCGCIHFFPDYMGSSERITYEPE